MSEPRNIETPKYILLACTSYSHNTIGGTLYDSPEEAVADFEKNHWRGFPAEDYSIFVAQVISRVGVIKPATPPLMSISPLQLAAPVIMELKEATEDDEIPF